MAAEHGVRERTRNGFETFAVAEEQGVRDHDGNNSKAFRVGKENEDHAHTCEAPKGRGQTLTRITKCGNNNSAKSPGATGK